MLAVHAEMCILQWKIHVFRVVERPRNFHHRIEIGCLVKCRTLTLRPEIILPKAMATHTLAPSAFYPNHWFPFGAAYVIWHLVMKDDS